MTLLAKARQQVRRQQADSHHKTTPAFVRANDVIYQEDMQTANMLKHHHFAESSGDAGWRAFLTILSDKAACAGRSVAVLPPAFTSQRCSGCAVLVAKGLSDRWHACPECGTSLHRDRDAALNIMALGKDTVGPSRPLRRQRRPVGHT